MLHLLPYLPQYDSGPSLHLAISNENNMAYFEWLRTQLLNFTVLIKTCHKNSNYLPGIAAAVAGASVVVGSKT